MPAPIGNANAAAQPRFPTHHNARGPELEHFLTVEAVFSTIQQLDTLPPHVTRLPQVERLFSNCSNVWGPERPCSLSMKAVSSMMPKPEFSKATGIPQENPLFHYVTPPGGEIESGVQVQAVQPVLPTADLPAALPAAEPGWHELARYINPDNSLTQAGMELAASAESEALLYLGTEPRAINFPITLAWIVERPETIYQIEVFRGRHFITYTPAQFVDQNAVLTSKGVTRAYEYLEKPFKTLRIEHIVDLINRRCFRREVFTEIDMFKHHGVNPFASRQIVSFRTSGKYRFTGRGLSWMSERDPNFNPLKPYLPAQ
jgi:hypothetical protein